MLNSDDETPNQIPAVFCYSLFYVYYDQYTYITGVLAQDIACGLLAVFVSIQVSLFFISLTFLGLEFNLNQCFHYNMCFLNFL